MGRTKPSESESSNVKLKVYYTPRKKMLLERMEGSKFSKWRRERVQQERNDGDDRNKGRVESSSIQIKRI